jgi:hypothetical protein
VAAFAVALPVAAEQRALVVEAIEIPKVDAGWVMVADADILQP